MAEGADLTPSRKYYYSPLRIRNPTPPPELLAESANADVIKGTGFSKSWVYSILLNLLEEVKRHGELEAEAEEGELVVEVSETQQDELGLLWDISMNSDVARFLMEPEYNTMDILATAVYKSRAPRITEICIGILGNLCSDKEICVTVSMNDELIKLICAVLSNIEFDPPTLKEAMRLVLTCLGNPEVRDRWLKVILDTPDLITLLLFVLESAVDVDLLSRTGNLLDTLMDTVDELSEAWACPELVNNILVALNQIGHQEKVKVEPFISVFYSLSTSQSGVESLVSHSEGVMKAVLRWLRLVCDEDILVVDDHLQAHNCAVSVLTMLFNNVPAVADHLITKLTLFKDMLKTLDALYNIHPACDNPATLPRCVFPTPRPKPSHQASAPSTKQTAEVENGNNTAQDCPQDGAGPATVDSQDDPPPSSEGGEGDSEQHNGDNQHTGERSDQADREEEEEDRGEEVVFCSNTVDYRNLLESCQEFFRNFFTHMKLEESPDHGDSKERGKHHHSTSEPTFYYVVRHLDRCPRRHVSYLVSSLVYTLPDPAFEGREWGEGSEEDMSGEGWQVVEHIRHLCGTLHLKRALEMLADVVSTVRLTAGVGD